MTVMVSRSLNRTYDSQVFFRSDVYLLHNDSLKTYNSQQNSSPISSLLAMFVTFFLVFSLARVRYLIW